MILVAGGDSFTWGSELQDTDQGKKHSNSTFSALLAEQANLEYDCAAIPGNSNTGIARLVIEACNRHPSEEIFVLVTWTFGQRYEFRFDYDTGEQGSPWYNISSWTIETVENIRGQMKIVNEIIVDHHIKNIKNAESSGIAEFARAFFKHVGCSEYYELYTTFKEILFLQNYLKVNNIPYMFTTADWQHENYLRSRDTSIDSLYNAIDWSNWFFFEPGHGPAQTEYQRGFYQWAVENKYSTGTTHPLEKAHADACKLMKGKFNELVKKHNQQN
jgi:hypothetical protein